MGCSGSSSGVQGEELELGKGHIMISYNHKHKKLTKEIKTVLEQNGFKVWRDDENMGGNIYEGMATAVEQSHVVLLCMSTEYHTSENCKKEALFASDKKKIIVPLVLERNFHKVDWLGLITSGRKYFDFTSKNRFKNGMKKLINDLRTYYRKDNDMAEAEETDIPEEDENDQSEDNSWYKEFIDCSDVEETGEAEGNQRDNIDVDENEEETDENNDAKANDEDLNTDFDNNGGENEDDEDNTEGVTSESEADND